MNKTRLFCRAFLITALCAWSLQAAVILDSTSLGIQSSDPTQIGRLVRTGLASNWVSPKAFPGINNNSVPFQYETFTVAPTQFPYLQISFDDPSELLFVSAYLNTYRPNTSLPNNGLSQNYLGDEGASINPFGNPNYFQIQLASPLTSSVVVVVTNTGGASGLRQPFNVLVEGFYDSSFNDTVPPVPEPLLSWTVPVVAALIAWRKRKATRLG